MKITLAELDKVIAEREWPEITLAIFKLKEYKVLRILHFGVISPAQWRDFNLDPNRMLDIQKRDGLWPATSKIQNILYNLGYVVFIEQLKITIWNHDPLTCVKLAYAKLHNLFDGQELEVV